MENNILELIASNPHIKYSSKIARTFGTNTAIILGALASKYCYWEVQNKLTEDGFFFVTAKDIEHETALSAKQQRAAISKLEEVGILETKLKGLPSIKYFKLNVEKLNFYILDSNTRSEEMESLDSTKGNILYDNMENIDSTKGNILYDNMEDLDQDVTKGNTNNIYNIYNNISNNDINKDIDIDLNKRNKIELQKVTSTFANSTNLPLSSDPNSFKDIVTVKDTDSTVNIDTVNTDTVNTDDSLKKDEIENNTMGIVNDRSLESNLHAGGSVAAECAAAECAAPTEGTSSSSKKPITINDLKNSKNYKDVIAYLNSLNYSNDIKEALIEWYNSKHIGNVSIKEIELNTDAIAKDCNNNENDILIAIKKSIERGWFKFYKQDNSYNNSYSNQRTPAATSSSKDRYYKVPDDYFKDIEEKVKNGEGEIF